MAATATGELVFTRLPVQSAISGGFGEWYTNSRGQYQHRGVDFACAEGTTILAPAPGRVVPFSNDGSFGAGVCLDHEGTPWYSLYAHMKRVDVFMGAVIEEGTKLGLSGATGFVTGPHLHWQVCKTTAFPPDISQSADPMGFLHDGSLSETEFWTAVLAGLDLEATPKRLAMLEIWADWEGMPFVRTWNPLATTSAHRPIELNLDFNIGHGPGNWNNVPVRVFKTATDGIRATVDTLKLHHYPNIRRSLADEDGYDEAVADLWTWGRNWTYAQSIVDSWKVIGSTDEEDDMSEVMAALKELNAALVMRNEIIHKATDPDIVAVVTMYEKLRAAGIVNAVSQAAAGSLTDVEGIGQGG